MAALEWFDRAESDLKYAQAGERDTGQHHITCFLCHQCVEKVLKGILMGNGKIPEKTHSLRKLLELVKKVQPDFGLSDSEVRRLDSYYVPSRYPGSILQEFNAEDAKTSLAIAEKCLSLLTPLLSKT